MTFMCLPPKCWGYIVLHTFLLVKYFIWARLAFDIINSTLFLLRNCFLNCSASESGAHGLTVLCDQTHEKESTEFQSELPGAFLTS